MNGETTYTKISDKDFIKLLEKSVKDANDYCEKLQQENQNLKDEVEELRLILGIRQKRGLISKFDKEFDEEDKKKNPNRDYADIIPDAEEVYKRYYEKKEKENNLIKYLKERIEISSADDTYINGMHFLSRNHAIYKDILERVKSGKYE